MAEADLVLYEKQGRVGIFTLNREKDRNAVNAALSKRMEELLDAFESDDEVWVGILASSSNVFCAGADLKSISKGENIMTKRGGFAGIVTRERRKPLIAAVSGAALAGGCEIVLACDLVVATENAVFGVPEVKRALVAAAGGLFRLPRKLPQNIAMQMVLTGDPISCADAHKYGLVNVVAKPGSAVATAIELAKKIEVNAPIAVQESRKVTANCFDYANDGEAFAASAAAFGAAAASADFEEGPRAFIEKRAPKWTGKPRQAKTKAKM
jgi:enoyl-CoA hydratase